MAGVKGACDALTTRTASVLEDAFAFLEVSHLHAAGLSWSARLPLKSMGQAVQSVREAGHVANSFAGGGREQTKNSQKPRRSAPPRVVAALFLYSSFEPELRCCHAVRRAACASAVVLISTCSPLHAEALSMQGVDSPRPTTA